MRDMRGWAIRVDLDGMLRDDYDRMFDNDIIQNDFHTYDVVNNVLRNNNDVNFIQRINDKNRKTIRDWEGKGDVATHKLGWAADYEGAFVFPWVQDINGKLIDFTDPKNNGGDESLGIRSALSRNDFVRMSPEDAEIFTTNYKRYAPGFAVGGIVDGPEDPVKKIMDARWMANRPFANTTVEDARRRHYEAERAAVLNRNTYNARNVSDNTSVRKTVPESVVLPTGETVMKDEPEQDNIAGLVSQTRLGRIESPVVDPIHDEPSGRMDTPVIDFLYGMTPWELAYDLKDSFGELKDNGFGEGRGLDAALSVASILPLGKIGKIAKNEEKILSKISKWSPEQWTAAQDAAIARGDMVEAQRLRDLHFGLSNSKYKEPLYRGTDENSPIMDLSKMQVNDVPAVYLTPYEKYARSYGDNVRKVYLNTQNPWIDKFGKDYSRFSVDGVKKRLDKAIQKGDNAKIEKYREILNDIEGTDAAYRYRIDGVNGDLTKIYEGTPPEILGKDVNKIKLADAVTYDDNGVRIPLGLRDNFNIGDIRYAIAPFLAGGIGLYNTKNK